MQRVRSEVVLPDENKSQPTEIAKMYRGINGPFVAYFLPDKRPNASQALNEVVVCVL